MFVAALGGRVPLLQLARWQLTTAFVLTAMAATVMGGWKSLNHGAIVELAASGFCGIVLASSSNFATIALAGPRLTALLFSLSSPFALALGYFAYGETIGVWQLAGIILVFAGIVLAVALPASGQAQGGEPPVTRAGIALGVFTAFGQALGNLFARPAMAAGAEPFAAMAVRLGISIIFFWALAGLPQVRRSNANLGGLDYRTIAASALFGNGLGMVLLMAALHSGNVGIVSTLSSMTPIVILPMVWARSRQRPAAAAWAGAVIAIIGTALISLNHAA